MKFDPLLAPARLLRRYKRFLADVETAGGRPMTVLCSNTGSMLGLTSPGARVWLSESGNPARKYRFTWEMIEHDLGSGPTLVGINASNPNAIVAEALRLGRVPELAGYTSLRREVRYGENSRIDFLLEGSADGRPCYVEVKNVHMMRNPGLAEFPDSRTERGAKHLRELASMREAGCRAVMLFLVQRADATEFAVCGDIDPAYAAAFELSAAAGVEMLAYGCALSREEIVLSKRLSITKGSSGAATEPETMGTPAAYPRRTSKRQKPR